MKLYYAPGASSLAAHIALREADRRFDLERVNLETRRTAGGLDYLELNPKGSVPLLELNGPGSDTLTEPEAVLQYIGDLAPDGHLVPPNGTFARYHLQEWLAFIHGEIHAPFALLLRGNLPAAVERDLRGRINERFMYIQEVLIDRAFLMGESFTVADAYLFVMLEWAEKLGLELQLWPNLDTYESRIANRPAVEAALSAEGLLERHRLCRSA